MALDLLKKKKSPLNILRKNGQILTKLYMTFFILTRSMLGFLAVILQKFVRVMPID